VTTTAEAVTVTSAGNVELTFAKAREWQLDTAKDLHVSAVASLAASSGLVLPIRWNQGCDGASNSCELVNAYDGTISVIESSPAVVRIATSYRNRQWSEPPESGCVTGVDYVIYPSGRVVGHVHIDDIGDWVSLAVFGIVSPSNAFTAVGTMPDRSFAFATTDGTSIIAHEPDNDVLATPWVDSLRRGFDLAHVLDKDNASPTAFDRVFELMIDQGQGRSPAERVSDARGVLLRQVSGANPVGSGYDRTLGAYVVKARAEDVAVTVAGSSNDIALVLEDFDATKWQIDRNGTVLATSDVPIADGIVTSYSAETRRLAIVLTPAAAGDVDLRIRALH